MILVMFRRPVIMIVITMYLARAVQVVHGEMFERKSHFMGHSRKDAREIDALPQSLLVMVNVIQEGPNIKCQTQVTASKKASHSISQLLMFNSVKHA